MIEKKRLEELIKAEETIYTGDSDVHLLSRWHFVCDDKLYEIHRYESEYLYDLEELFETEKEADLIDSYKKGLDKDKTIEELKQQLAEKDKKIEELKDKYKISFAIEQLEKVKEEFISEVWDLYDTADLLEQVCELRNQQVKFIDNQINELKGNVEDVKD